MKVFYNQIYMAHLGNGEGSEQSGDRPVLVIDSYRSSPVCVIVPITLERLNDDKNYHVDLNNDMGTALIEQIRTISKTRIYSVCRVNNEYARIDEDDRYKINEQLLRICQLKPLQNLGKNLDIAVLI